MLDGFNSIRKKSATPKNNTGVGLRDSEPSAVSQFLQNLPGRKYGVHLKSMIIILPLGFECKVSPTDMSV